jgi:hypothetical protein
MSRISRNDVYRPGANPNQDATAPLTLTTRQPVLTLTTEQPVPAPAPEP